MKKNKDLKDLIDDIQKKINFQEEKTYSKKVIDEYRNPLYFGFIENPNGNSKIKGPCGDTMQITLKIINKKIIDARFWTDGCGATIACGNMLIKLIKNKKIDEISNISKEKLLDELHGLPEEQIHCAKLTVDTFINALNDFKKKKI